MSHSKKRGVSFFTPKKLEELTSDMADWLHQASARCSNPSINSASTFTANFKTFQNDSTTQDTTSSVLGLGENEGLQNTFDASSRLFQCDTSESLTMDSNRTNRNNPGIILLLDRGQWKRAQERAKKYPKECKATAYIKRVGKESVTKRSVDLGISNLTIDASGSSTSPMYRNGSKWIKVKALHHACKMLRKVHREINRSIVEQMKQHQTRFHASPLLPTTSSYDDSEDGTGRSCSSCFSYTTSFERNHQQEDWSDPWIEACDAILAILDAYPDAASMRESGHGCLPLHLAVFAMCPCPTVDLSMNTESISDSPAQPNTVVEDLPSPRGAPFGHVRRPSASSLGSNSFGDISSTISSSSAKISSFSNVNQITSWDLSSRLDEIEFKLRNSHDKILSLNDQEEVLESARLMSRPSALNSRNTRGTSAGTIGTVNSTCSDSMISRGSTVVSSPTNRSHFDLKLYEANSSKRDEATMKVLKALIKAFPKGVQTDSEGGRLPLHFALSGQATFQVIDALIKAYPDAVRHRIYDTSLPIHIAAQNGVSDPKVMSKLLSIYPDGCLGKNLSERTPEEEALLIAGENGRMHQAEILLELRRQKRAFFEVLSQPHLALKRQGPDQSDKKVALIGLIRDRRWDTIILHIDSFKDQLREIHRTELKGGLMAECTALYLACERQPSVALIEAILRLYPESSILQTNPGNHTPLHALCTYDGSLSVVGLLIATSPSAVKNLDALGNLPLHCACYSGASISVVETLLCADPKTVEIRNQNKNTAIDIVRRLDRSDRRDVLRLLESTSLEILKKKRQYDSIKLAESTAMQINCHKQKKSSVFQIFSDKRKSKESKNTIVENISYEAVNTVTGDVEIGLADDGMLWL